MRETLVTRGTQGIELIDLSLLRLGAGEREMLVDDGELCAVVLSGAVEAEVNGAALGRAARKGNVFESLGDAVYVPPSEQLQVVASTDAVIAVATAPVGGGVPGRARMIGPRPARARRGHRELGAHDPHDSRTGRRGRAADPRRDPQPTRELVLLPPHKHDRNAPPDEVALEEVYLYRFEPAAGFGVQLVYDDTDERAESCGTGMWSRSLPAITRSSPLRATRSITCG